MEKIAGACKRSGSRKGFGNSLNSLPIDRLAATWGVIILRARAARRFFSTQSSKLPTTIGTGARVGTVALKVNSFVNFVACNGEESLETSLVMGWRGPWCRKTFGGRSKAMD